MEIAAPVVAVTVHPGRARVTRRGTAALVAGRQRVVLAGLPATLLPDSVRVAGRAEADVRVLGVDVVHRDLVDAPDGRVAAAEAALREAEREVAAVDGADAGDAAHEKMLHRLARRGGDRLAVALADGTAGAARIAEVGGAVAAQLVDVAARRRAHAERRTDAERRCDAARAELERLTASGRSRRDAVVDLEVGTDGEAELELAYVVEGASWTTAYDARLDGDELVLTWYGMVAQTTGEDWPECELTLSTARPATAVALPELDPWWVDAVRPLAVPAPMAAAAPVPGGRRAPAAPQRKAAAVTEVIAEPVDARVGAVHRLARPTAVAADGTPHRTTIAELALPARLDHVTAPALGPEVHLRATVEHTGAVTLPAGPVSTFLDGAFAGTTRLGRTAPGAELELALGVDDRVVVERELADRTPHRGRLGASRGAVEHWTTTITNRRDAAVRLLVRDRVPVSRHSDVKVVYTAFAPEPDERDDLGRVEWRTELEPGAAWTGSVRFGVTHPKELTVPGWG